MGDALTEAQNAERQARAFIALVGLSVGDAFGQLFFRNESLQHFSKTGERPKQLPEAPWNWTDDTALACALYEHLRAYHTIRPDELAMSFGMTYQRDPNRAYGAGMHELLPRYASGAFWHLESPKRHAGQGSFGNGSAMRVAPLGAYFADNLNQVEAMAEASAVVTHSHPEAVAGTIAVAVAAAIAWQTKEAPRPDRSEFLNAILEYVPVSEVRSKIARARDARAVVTTYTAAQMLGNGSQITAMDTVPFALFSAAQHLDNFEAALWHTAEALGDVDTNCAIVAGIMINRVGTEQIPAEWLARREPLSNTVVPT